MSSIEIVFYLSIGASFAVVMCVLALICVRLMSKIGGME